MSRPKQLLLIDDDEHIQEVVRVAALAEGYELTLCSNGNEGLRVAEVMNPDLLILDIMMPGLNGWEVCKALRAKGATVPILMLTAKDAEEDEILGLQLGADDYITKPFSPRQLMARVQALLRRSSSPQGTLLIDLDRREAYVYGHALELTPKEFELLAFFSKRAGRVIHREEVLSHIWGMDYMGTTRTVDEHVKRVRQKLSEKAGEQEFIHTIWGVGYRFEVET